MGLKSSDWCPYQKKRGDRETHREDGHVKMWAEIGGMLPRAKEPRMGPSEAGGGKEGLFPRAFRESRTLRTPRFCDSRPLNCENKSRSLKPPHVDHFVLAARGKLVHKGASHQDAVVSACSHAHLGAQNPNAGLRSEFLHFSHVLGVGGLLYRTCILRLPYIFPDSAATYTSAHSQSPGLLKTVIQ